MEKFELDQTGLKGFALSLYQRLNGEELPVFLCVGSDKFVCDSLAPIVAELLTKKYNIKGYVYGGLGFNINASNLTTSANYVDTYHAKSQRILIDATLGDDVGKVCISSNCFAGAGKVLPIRKIGNFGILGVVGPKIKNFSLNSTRLGLIMNLANFIAKGIAMALWYKQTKSSVQTNYN